MLRTLALLLLSSGVYSQNYVVNGSFERTASTAIGRVPTCAFSGNPGILNNMVEGWQTYTDMTPDLLVTPDSADCSFLPRPRTGSRMVGLIMYHPAGDGKGEADYHELIQGTLAKPLEPGKTYLVRFRTRTDDSLGVLHLSGVYGTSNNILPVRCGNFGFRFSTNKIQVYEDFMQSQSIFPMKPQINWDAVVETPGGAWTEISMLFTPDQPCRYFLFGNFFFDAVTPVSMSDAERYRIDEANRTTAPGPQKIRRIAYYCFDDFVVSEYRGSDYAKKLLEEQILTFQAELFFDVDQAALKPAAKISLEQLASALRSLPELHIEIGGHTDNTGSVAYNQDLSERRARAVCDFLTEKGVNSSQLRWKGYGEAQPIATNDTDTGRQQNRRVECRVGQ